ncbi:MAG: helix-turn-helix domain-containing protein [bacterium]|nr:helix-turn-helix domain-containing protein [bacterium]
MTNTDLTFNDLPLVVAQLRDEVVGLKQLIMSMQSEKKQVKADMHKPMSVDEAAEYLRMPKDTLYYKLCKGDIPATKPGKRYCLYRDELDKWLECHRKHTAPLSDDEQNATMMTGNRRKPKPLNW